QPLERICYDLRGEGGLRDRRATRKRRRAVGRADDDDIGVLGKAAGKSAAADEIAVEVELHAAGAERERDLGPGVGQDRLARRDLSSLGSVAETCAERGHQLVAVQPDDERNVVRVAGSL